MTKASHALLDPSAGAGAETTLRAPATRRPTFADRVWPALVVAAIAFTITANAYGLIEPTETRYAEIAREMRASGDWLTPHLNGLPHLSKPPFAYWATALGLSAFGENGWGARLPVAVASLAAMAFAALAVRRRFGALGMSPALTTWLLASMAVPFVFGRALATDPFLAAAVAAFWGLAPSPLAIAALGLGFLTKGPVVFLPTLLPVIVAAAWERSRAPLRLLGPRWAWLIAAAIALPWYAIVAARTPGLPGYWLGNEMWQRYTTHVHKRSGAAWYFVAVLIAGSLPWTIAFAAGSARAWRQRHQMDARLLFAWLVVPTVFLSFSGSKLPAYLLPCFPVVGILAALGLEHAGRGVRLWTATILLALVAATIVAAPRWLAHMVGATAAAPALPPAFIVTLAAWTLAAVALLASRTRWAPPLVLAGWVALWVGLAPYEGPLGSPRPLARALEAHREAGQPIVEYHRFNAGLPFYLREHARLLDVDREAFFRSVGAREDMAITRDSLRVLIARHGTVWILAPLGEGEGLADSLGYHYRRLALWMGRSLGAMTNAS